MPKLRLTDAVVGRAALPPDKTDAVLWDADLTGFGLRLRPTGKSWILAYRPAGSGRAGQFKRLKLGTPQTIKTATEARSLARVMLGRIAAGADPLAERKRQRAQKVVTLADTIDRYERDLERRQYVNSKIVVAGFRNKMAAFLDRDIAQITGAELASVIEEMEAAGKPGGAQNFRARARTFFGWCATKAKVISANPMAGHRKERATRADRIAKAQHGRALSDEELLRVWNTADPGTVFGRLIRFYILTGCRRGEGAGLTRPMVDREAGLINFPAVFVKQGRGHLVPIAPTLAALLDRCPLDARSGFVFASPRSGGKLSGWTQYSNRFTGACGVDFNLHDLRRTFRTGLSRLGVNADVAELALGHARTELEAIYNRDAALETLRSAFERWADHVQTLVTADIEKQIALKQGLFG